MKKHQFVGGFPIIFPIETTASLGFGHPHGLSHATIRLGMAGAETPRTAEMRKCQMSWLFHGKIAK